MNLGHFTVLDGGMGHELLRRSQGVDRELWSAQVLIDNPELVSAVHQEFVDVGAQVIITNTYATIPSYLKKANLQARYLDLALQAGKLARQVADGSPQAVQVAGSIPPLAESYRFDLVPADDEAQPVYDNLVGTLAPYVDLFVCETMSCVREAVNAVGAVRRCSSRPVWVSWTLHETPGAGLRSEESIAQAVAAVAPFAPDAYLLNCSSPQAITVGLQQLRELVDKPMGAYPNLLHISQDWTLDSAFQGGLRELSVDGFVEFCRTWRDLGASILGGCCGIGPDYIAALKTQLDI